MLSVDAFGLKSIVVNEENLKRETLNKSNMAAISNLEQMGVFHISFQVLNTDMSKSNDMHFMPEK